MSVSRSAAADKIPQNAQLAAFREGLLAEAERIVLEDFPKKVIEFNELLLSDKFAYSRLSEILPDPGLNIPVPAASDIVEVGESDDEDEPAKKKIKVTNGKVASDEVPNKKRKIQKIMHGKIVSHQFQCGVIPSNEHLMVLMDEIRPKIRDAVENMNKIKMWITLMIPRIEDGNNFGVGIQEETLNEVRTVEGEAASFLDQLSRYFVGRAKLLTKVAKYPFVADYRRAILDMDEKQFVNLRLVITEIRNHFASLHDQITKNLEKIKKPRTSNHDNMY